MEAARKPKVVGLDGEVEKFRDLLTDTSSSINKVSLVGMAGIGKTTLARRIYDDRHVSAHFRLRVWVTVGRERPLTEIQRFISAQLDPDSSNWNNTRHLIVLDDVWETDLSCLDLLLPQCKDRRVLLTSRVHPVAKKNVHLVINVNLLSDDESWLLLRHRLFGEDRCPYRLEAVGKKIAEKCDGLPLMIITVANLLLKVDKTPEYWDKVVAEKDNTVFADAYDEISKVLSSSYDNLSQYIKTFFLYMGVFPPKYEIPASMLVKLWISEGFLEPDLFQTSEDLGARCLKELVSNSVILACQKSTMPNRGMKTCRLQSAFWHLCKNEARKDKFFCILNRCKDCGEEDIKGQPRLCIHNNVLFGIKQVYKSIEDNCAPSAISLLCFGPYYPYAVPICFGLVLLKVLEALRIRFYEFPVQVLKLEQLKYFALTYNGNLPTSISRLQSLKFLIVHRHMSIKYSGAPSYLPEEIWDMEELKHLQITGSNLPNPHHAGAHLPNLSALLDVSAHSCSRDIFKRVTNLKKLGIRIELGPDADEPLSFFESIPLLSKLESLKCVIVNPELKPAKIVAPFPIFPSSLQKLSLSGLGYPWEEMSKIASLPYLKVLKLQQYAFRGPKWEVQERGFLRLHFLLIEDTDLEQWKHGGDSFRLLTSLTIKNCYKLEEIHWDFGILFEKIEVVDCSPSAVKRAKEIKEAQLRKGYNVPDVCVISSWADGNLK